MNDNMTFTDIHVTDNLVQSLSVLHIKTPTRIQQEVIPVILTGNHVLFQSETGTGKTFAYLLPLIQKIKTTVNINRDVKLFIVSPTYELASQIRRNIQSITDLKTVLLIGGVPIKRQIETLKEKPDIIIGTPARLTELIHLKKLKATGLLAVVFDEADRLISRELCDETINLFKLLPENIQVIACSATITHKTQQVLTEMLSARGQSGREIKTVYLAAEDILKKRITHWAVFAEYRDKIDTLRQLLAAETPIKALVFISRSDQVDNIVLKLQYKKVNCAGLYAKTDKIKRKTVIDSFRNGKCPILVTTDLAARGLDIPGITHIIQMDLPSSDDSFIHRAGRTGRAGNTGINVVIGDAYEMQKYADLEKRLGITVYPRQLNHGIVTEPQR